MILFYVKMLFGFDVEYGWGGVEVYDNEWCVVYYEIISIWGYKFIF